MSAVTAPVVACRHNPTSNSSATTGPISFLKSVSVGATLVIAIVSNGTGRTFGVSDSKGNDWQQMSVYDTTANPAHTLGVFTTKVTNALTTSDGITVTTSGTNITSVSFLVAEMANVDERLFFGNTSSSTATNVITGAPVDTKKDSMSIMCVGSRGPGANFWYTDNDEWSLLESVVAMNPTNPRSVGIYFRQSPENATVTPVGSFSIGTNYTSVAMDLTALPRLGNYEVVKRNSSGLTNYEVVGRVNGQVKTFEVL